MPNAPSDAQINCTKLELARLETVRIGGLKTVRADRNQLANWTADACEVARRAASPPVPKLIFSSNGQGIALYGEDSEYDEAMEAADVIHADGMPVVLASRILTRRPILQRSATTDLFHDVARIAQERGLRTYVLGSNEQQNRLAVAEIERAYPNLKIVGRRDGYFSETDQDTVCDAIRRSGAEILWVGLGKPKQEIWCFRNREQLKGVACIITCGGLYAFLTGETRRAPNWMQVSGLEWAFRLAQEPRRLFKRYMITNLKSAWRMIVASS